MSLDPRIVAATVRAMHELPGTSDEEHAAHIAHAALTAAVACVPPAPEPNEREWVNVGGYSVQRAALLRALTGDDGGGG